MTLQDNEDFLALKCAVDELRSTSRTGAKVSILASHLEAHPRLHLYLHATYDPFVNYYATSAKLKKTADLIPGARESQSVLHTLRSFSTRAVSGHESALEWRASVSCLHRGLGEYANLVLDKDLKVRMGVKLINKALKLCKLPRIKTFSVALGHPWENAVRVWETDTWYASRKLDGVRCLAFLRGDGDVRFYSRQGKELCTLGALAPVLSKYRGVPMVLDGEVSLRTADGRDDFQGLMKLIKRKQHTIDNPCFHVFDALTHEEFTKRKSKSTFWERQQRVRLMVSQMDEREERVRRVKQYKVTSERMSVLLERVQRLGWEGLILRRDAPYQGKRSKDVLKVKEFHDEEHVIQGIEVGPFSVVQNGREAVVETMTAAWIVRKGNRVDIGSGWTLEQRHSFYANPKRLVGRTVTVQYFEETVDSKTGLPSLRFPTVKHIHGKAREL